MPGALHLEGGSSASIGMRPVLIIIDMQEHFRDGMAERILPQLNSLIDACRRLGVPIIFTQHGHPDPVAEERSSVLVRWWGADGSIRLGSPAWELLPELYRLPDDPVIQSKRTYDAFQGTELLGLLEERGCDTLVVGGVMTNLCCETTARSAFTEGFSVLFLSDGTATANKRMHDASLLNLGYGFAHIMTCSQAAAALAAAVEGERQ
ncbi:hypothetical protein ABPG77_002821 [Micractinium sp. CCAP 211/92]